MRYTPKSVRTLSATLFTIGSLAAGANAAVTITISEDGSDVRVQATGTLNITGTSFLTNIGYSPNLAVNPSSGTLLFAGSHSVYTNNNTTPSFGAGAGLNTLTVTGDRFGFEALSPTESLLFVPSGFVSGSSISSEGVFAGSTLTSLGVLPGTYVYTLPNDSINITVIPETTSAILLGLGSMSLLARRRRQ